uniref:Glycosyltransferase family 1 protein n=1 Tax=candidate division WWE3 bacterium TaxID=2053526 RepID=A0A7C4XI14_UNCKA
MDSKKINVISEAVSPIFHKRRAEEVNSIKDKYKLNNKRYLFFVSTIQPRKNVPNMVAGFASYIKENNINDLDLVVAGKLGWMYEESLASPKKYGVEDSVKFLGAVPTEDLPKLMSGAAAFINLSFEEGFGLPLLEAMACGVPCIVSDIPAYKELDKGNLIFVDPFDVESIKMGIQEFFDKSEEQVEDLIMLGIRNVERFSWEKTAEETLEVLSS